MKTNDCNRIPEDAHRSKAFHQLWTQHSGLSLAVGAQVLETKKVVNLTPWSVFLILKSQLVFLSFCDIICKSRLWVQHQRWSSLWVKWAKIVNHRMFLCSWKFESPKTWPGKKVLRFFKLAPKVMKRQKLFHFQVKEGRVWTGFSSCSPNLTLRLVKEQQSWNVS